MPRVISNQKFNDALKEIMKAVYEANPESTLAGYVTKAYTADVGNGRAGRKTDIYQRWQMVSCHTGRRSFATNMRLRGNDRDVICAATGHKLTEASHQPLHKEDRLTRASRLKRTMQKEKFFFSPALSIYWFSLGRYIVPGLNQTGKSISRL